MKLLSANSISDVFGKVTPPPGTPQIAATDPQTGLVKLLNVGLNVVLIAAGLYTLLNLILAGYMYITSAGDTKKVQEANLRMTYTVIGLVIITLTPLLAALIGFVAFGRWDAILNPNFKTINELTP